jgi:phenylalanyl-tRNA synthetase alpha chain
MNLDEILKDAEREFAAAGNLPVLDQVKARFIGKSGAITEQMKGLGALPPEQRKAAGAQINQIKDQVEALLKARREAIQAGELGRQLAAESLDVTLPGRGVGVGGLHPVSRALARIEELFASIGFVVADGPEIETDFYNFTALNIPGQSSGAGDARHLLPGWRCLLRTHTSPVQVHYMQDQQPPIRIIAPGRVYRCDSDATHSPMFHQVEGLWVDEQVSFRRPERCRAGLHAALFRARRSESAFPSVLLPVYRAFGRDGHELGRCVGKSLAGIGGCGMVHPNVFSHVGIDPERYQGFAFGMGVERLAMLRYGVDDLRLFFENDVRFLKQFA